MEEIFKKRVEELDLEKEEKEFILSNLNVCAKIYFRGIKDISLSNFEYKTNV